ncbi:MAG: UDP-N-acetylglucosamine--N-acetylmuramyl-(pentapeptide) pyrophosphoryl-undecaprenol [Clostridiales bacterium]|nr:UDP-N-acetylglucosamine--N-acetylmuramyl-(pentapeptide) pyrophosphoryl-undecaprenol [Clostridiales bacterium]
MKFIIAGGGTGGHINPGIAIAKYIKQKQPDAEIIFVGTERGLETKLVPREGFELKLIKVKGFRRKLSLDTLVSVKEMFQGFLESQAVIKKFKPDMVIGTGGYVCGPLLFNAALMKIPTLIHEQNAFPGVTNRILSRFVDVVAISFKESEQYFKSAKKRILTGNPVRTELLKVDRASAREKLGIKNDQNLVVVMGGSLGAEKINSTVAEMIKSNNNLGFKLIFGTGNSQFNKINKELEATENKNIEVVPYIYDAANVYAAADLIVCRAGAITCSELTLLGVPSIMIPSPNVTANHQEHNARALEKQGASIVVLEQELTAELLYNQIVDLLKNKTYLNKMAKDAKKIGILNSTEKIYSMLEELISPM